MRGPPVPYQQQQNHLIQQAKVKTSISPTDRRLHYHHHHFAFLSRYSTQIPLHKALSTKMVQLTSILAFLAITATPLMADPLPPEATNELQARDQSWDGYFWSVSSFYPSSPLHAQDTNARFKTGRWLHEKTTISGTGPKACTAISNKMCLTGEVSETGFLAGGLKVCVYAGAGCTGANGYVNDSIGGGGPIIFGMATLSRF